MSKELDKAQIKALAKLSYEESCKQKCDDRKEPLKALEKIGKLETIVGLRVIPTKTIVKDFAEYNIIETALKELEYLKEVKNMDDFYKKNNAIIDYELIGKKLKAFEIIKNKKVNVEWLLESENVEEYNESLYIDLAQEEYDLLIEVLL